MTFFIRKLGPLNRTILFSFMVSKQVVFSFCSIFSFLFSLFFRIHFHFVLLSRGDTWLEVRRVKLPYIIWKGVFLVSLFYLIVIMIRMVFISCLFSFILNMSS